MHKVRWLTMHRHHIQSQKRTSNNLVMGQPCYEATHKKDKPPALLWGKVAVEVMYHSSDIAFQSQGLWAYTQEIISGKGIIPLD